MCRSSWCPRTRRGRCAARRSRRGPPISCRSPSTPSRSERELRNFWRSPGGGGPSGHGRRGEGARAAWLAPEVAAAVAVIEAREREIVMLLMKAAEHRDTDTGEHVARVAAYVQLICEALGLPADECRQLSLASTMHDVGKIGVSDAILLKPARLTADERAEMQEHAERGRRILEASSSDLVRLAAEIAAAHHERFDGKGYPSGLKGEAI